VKRFVLLAMVVVMASGCSTRQAVRGAASSVGPQLSVERFLQAANARDHQTMAGIFGTPDGPVGDTGSSFGCFWKKLGTLFGGESCQSWQEIELWMDTLAQVLQHQNYEIVSQRDVAGRGYPTTRVGVDLVVSRNRTVRDVGFEVVRADDQWLIEAFELEKLTGGD